MTGDKETPELSNTVESSLASELPASPTRGPAKPPNPPKNPKNPKPRAGPAKPHVPQAEPNKKADAPKIGPKANKPSAGGRGKKRALTAGDDTQEPQPKRQRQQRSAAKVAQQKLSEEKVTETDGDEAADNE